MRAKHWIKQTTMNRPCLIGIDPAFRKDGFCVVIIDEQKTASAKIFKSFLDFLKWLPEAPANAIVTIENSNEEKALFAYLQKGSAQKRIMSAMSVGKNMAASQYTVDACRYRWEHTGKVYSVSPSRKGAKWTSETFRDVLRADGIELASPTYFGTQDARDAYKLATLGQRLAAQKV